MPALADPTLDFIRSLDEPGKFVVGKPVPIMKPHVRVPLNKDGKPLLGKDGKPKRIVVTPDRLPKIAERINRLERDEGLVMKMTIGHVKTNVPEHEQAPLVGFFRGATVGTFGPQNEPCILSTPYFLPECYEEARHFPHRSADFFPAELHPDMDEIRGVALLVREPYLDMGMVTYSANGPAVVYALADSDMDSPTETTPDQPAAPEGHDGWLANMNHYASSNEWVKYARQCYEGSAPMAGTASTPNATNASVPAATPAVPDALPLPRTPEQMQKDSDAVQYSRLEGRIATLEAENKELRGAASRAECERLVTQLEAECYELNRAEEVAELVELDAAGRDKHLARVRKHYRKLPYAKMIPVYTGAVEGAPESAGPTEQQTRMAVSLATQKGISFDAALAEVKTLKP